jgi:hypothetical protein
LPSQEEIIEWLNTVPDYTEFEIPSSGDVTTEMLGQIAGMLDKSSLAEVLELILGRFKVNSAYEIFGGQISPAPFGRNAVNRFPGIIDSIGKYSNRLAVGSLILDLGNTWTADSGNTNGQRVIKSVTQIGGYFASNEIGMGSIKLGVAIASRTHPAVGVIGGGATALGGGVLVDKLTDFIYDIFEIA